MVHQWFGVLSVNTIHRHQHYQKLTQKANSKGKRREMKKKEGAHADWGSDLSVLSDESDNEPLFDKMAASSPAVRLADVAESDENRSDFIPAPAVSSSNAMEMVTAPMPAAPDDIIDRDRDHQLALKLQAEEQQLFASTRRTLLRKRKNELNYSSGRKYKTKGIRERSQDSSTSSHPQDSFPKSTPNPALECKTEISSIEKKMKWAEVKIAKKEKATSSNATHSNSSSLAPASSRPRPLKDLNQNGAGKAPCPSPATPSIISMLEVKLEPAEIKVKKTKPKPKRQLGRKKWTHKKSKSYDTSELNQSNSQNSELDPVTATDSPVPPVPVLLPAPRRKYKTKAKENKGIKGETPLPAPPPLTPAPTKRRRGRPCGPSKARIAAAFPAPDPPPLQPRPRGISNPKGRWGHSQYVHARLARRASAAVSAQTQTPQTSSTTTADTATAPATVITATTTTAVTSTAPAPLSEPEPSRPKPSTKSTSTSSSTPTPMSLSSLKLSKCDQCGMLLRNVICLRNHIHNIHERGIGSGSGEVWQTWPWQDPDDYGYGGGGGGRGFSLRAKGRGG